MATMEPVRAEELCWNNPIFSYDDVVNLSTTVMTSLNIFHLSVQGWVIFLRNDFDCVVNGEPYQALSFLLFPESGQFFARVWNKTIQKGFLTSTEGIGQKLEEVFLKKSPCLGVSNTTGEPDNSNERVITADFYSEGTSPQTVNIF